MQLPSGNINAQYATVNGFRLREALKEVRPIERIHAGARSGYVADTFAYTQTGLVALQSLLGDCHTHGADKKYCRS
jgi:hypothetical protein